MKTFGVTTSKTVIDLSRIFLLLTLITMNSMANEITAYYSSEQKKIWFHSSHKESLFIATSGSVLNAREIIDENGNLNLSPRTHGHTWLMYVPNNKPHIKNGIQLTNTEKIDELFLENKHRLVFGIPLYKVDATGKFSGPILSDPIILKKIKPGFLDRSSLLLVPINLK